MPKPEDSEYICWIDLECTGSRPSDRIIEVGAVMTDRDFQTLSERSYVASWPSDTLPMIPVVQEMHTVNGLINDSKDSKLTLADIDEKLTDWIKSYSKSNHVPLAGSGVGHFDRYYIRKDLPVFDEHLTYWVYDVGVIRRVLKLFGILDPSADSTHRGKSHRALDDIRDHISEMLMYKTLLTSSHAIVKHMATSITGG